MKLFAKYVFSVWRASGNLRVDLPLMNGIIKRYKKETNKNYFDDVLPESEKADYEARLK